MTEYRKDEYKKVQIPFGYNERAVRVLLSLFHTFFVAMTGHGKTLGMKSLLLRFHQLFPEWKILIIDSKDKRDYADLNADIPICFVETTDPLDLKNLLEPVVGAKLMYYFDKIIEEAVFDTLGEIHRSIHRKVQDADCHNIKISGKDLGKLRVIDYTMGKLVALVEKPNIVRELKLHDGFNVMPVALPDVKNPNLKRAFQQLIVRSVLLLLLSDQSLEKTLLVLDESHKWSSQKYASICKQPLSEFVSEGRSQDKFVWLSDQALTKVDKEPLKNIKLWIVGQQMESNEVEDARETVNSITDLNVKDSDIKTLKVGNFILVDGLHGKVERAYLQPYNVPEDVALKIVQGADPELAEPYIRRFEQGLLKSQSQEGDEELVYKEKFEKLQKEFEESEKKRKELEKEVARTASFDLLNEEVTRLQKELVELRPLKGFRDAMLEMFPQEAATAAVTSVSIAEIDERINQRIATLGPERIVSVDVDARIKELVKNEVVNRLVTKIQRLTDPAKKAAWWLHERKRCSIKELYNYVYDKTEVGGGRVPGTFYMSVVNPLTDAWLISNESGNIRWVLQDKLTAELKTVLTNEDIDKVPKYLASLLL